jgi:regulatory protein YycH of two-component signal transduction system YycFG
MNKLKRQQIERIKNLTLAVLFFMTALLLFFFWGSPITKGFKISNFIGPESFDVPSFDTVTIPGRTVVHLGDGKYTVLETDGIDAWNIYLDTMKTLTKNHVESVDEITEEQFDKIMEFKSIFFRFYYDLPNDVFIKKYGASDMFSTESIGEFTILAFSSGSPESLFVYSSPKNKYYRVVSKSPHQELDELISQVKSRESSTYYRIGDMVGSANKTVIPLHKKSDRHELSFSKEYSDPDSDAVKTLAGSFFGESLDFVRQIRGSKGTLTYMYGYGEKVLTIGSEGRVEYKNRETPQGNQQSYLEALDLAMQFVATHGGWQTNGSIEMAPYVMSVIPVEKNKQKGYRIVFGMKFSKEFIYLENSHSIMVEVIHGQVVQYLRNLVRIDEEEYQAKVGGAIKEAYSAINMIAQNYNYIAQILVEKGYDLDLGKGEELFDDVTNSIIFVKTGYLKPEGLTGEKGMLIPVWVVNAENILIYFDLFDAAPLGYADLYEF